MLVTALQLPNLMESQISLSNLQLICDYKTIFRQFQFKQLKQSSRKRVVHAFNDFVTTPLEVVNQSQDFATR